MDHHKLREKDKMEDMVEGEELQKLSFQNKMEKERLESIRKDEKRQLMEDNQRQIEERIALKKLQENQEDVSDRLYVSLLCWFYKKCHGIVVSLLSSLSVSSLLNISVIIIPHQTYFNPLPDDKMLDWSKLKQIVDDILKCI